MAIPLRSLFQSSFSCFFVACLLGAASRALEEKEVLKAMRRATDFMMNKVSNRGGFLWHYTADLANRWGEVALKSQTWAQPTPNSPTAGEMLKRTIDR